MSNDAAGERWRLKARVSVDEGHGENWREQPWHPLHDFVTCDYLNELEQALAAANERAALANVKVKLLDDTFAMLRGSSEFMPLTIHRRYDALTAQRAAESRSASQQRA